jgi:nucleotide-binding universal stress UspA family protein
LTLNAPSRAFAVVEEAQAGGYGTIVVGRRGISKVEEFLLGRVSSKVVGQAAQAAVWVVN